MNFDGLILRDAVSFLFSAVSEMHALRSIWHMNCIHLPN